MFYDPLLLNTNKIVNDLIFVFLIRHGIEFAVFFFVHSVKLEEDTKMLSGNYYKEQIVRH